MKLIFVNLILSTLLMCSEPKKISVADGGHGSTGNVAFLRVDQEGHGTNG